MNQQQIQIKVSDEKLKGEYANNSPSQLRGGLRRSAEK